MPLSQAGNIQASSLGRLVVDQLLIQIFMSKLALGHRCPNGGSIERIERYNHCDRSNSELRET